MRVIIAGSRNIVADNFLIDRVVKESGYKITMVISGCARGIDKAGERWAKLKDIHTYYVPAAWDLYGKKAGVIRNSVMARNADAAIVIWDGVSRGSKNMIDAMKKLGKPCYVYKCP